MVEDRNKKIASVNIALLEETCQNKKSAILQHRAACRKLKKELFEHVKDSAVPSSVAKKEVSHRIKSYEDRQLKKSRLSMSSCTSDDSDHADSQETLLEAIFDHKEEEKDLIDRNSLAKKRLMTCYEEI